jgi:hypothetical protein
MAVSAHRTASGPNQRLVHLGFAAILLGVFLLLPGCNKSSAAGGGKTRDTVGELRAHTDRDMGCPVPQHDRYAGCELTAALRVVTNIFFKSK